MGLYGGRDMWGCMEVGICEGRDMWGCMEVGICGAVWR